MMTVSLADSAYAGRRGVAGLAVRQDAGPPPHRGEFCFGPTSSGW